MERITRGFRNILGRTSGAINRTVSSAPTTNWKVFTAIVCGVLSVVMYWILALIDRSPEEITFGMLLTFILTWLFDGRKQFEIKRKTEWKRDGYTIPAELQEQSYRRRDSGREDGTEPV